MFPYSIILVEKGGMLNLKWCKKIQNGRLKQLNKKTSQPQNRSLALQE